MAARERSEEGKGKWGGANGATGGRGEAGGVGEVVRHIWNLKITTEIAKSFANIQDVRHDCPALYWFYVPAGSVVVVVPQLLLRS